MFRFKNNHFGNRNPLISSRFGLWEPNTTAALNLSAHILIKNTQETFSTKGAFNYCQRVSFWLLQVYLGLTWYYLLKNTPYILLLYYL